MEDLTIKQARFDHGPIEFLLFSDDRSRSTLIGSVWDETVPSRFTSLPSIRKPVGELLLQDRVR